MGGKAKSDDSEEAPLEAEKSLLYQRIIISAEREARIAAELPFMATEDILMAGVQAGGDRQELHERIRRHAQAAAREVKEQGRPNDLLDRLAGDSAFSEIDMRSTLNPKRYVGRAPQQVDDFLRTIVTPIRRRHRKSLGMASELNV